MANKPVIFISATSDLRSARDLVGKVLYSMGFEPDWQDIAATDGGELLDVLRKRIEPAALVIQLVGRRYGAEPPQPSTDFGRVSYTQFEALEAERVGKKVIYHFLDDSFPVDPAAAEPPELVSLQAAYRQRLKDTNRLRYDQIADTGQLELSVRRISDELATLRRQADRRQRNLVRLGAATVVGIAAVAALTFALFHETRSAATQTADRLDKGTKETAAKLDKLAADMAELRKAQAVVAAAVSPKPLAAGQTQPDPIPPEILAQARLLLERGNEEQRALGMIALKQHAAADRLIQQLKSKPGNPLDEACRLLTLEGDNWYQANQPGKAVGPYEQAFALKPKDFPARNKLTIALISARLGNTAARCGRAIDISEQTLRLVPPGSTNWARTQNNLGVAWRDLPTGDKAENVKKAIAAYEAALAVYTKDADPVDWARVHCDLGLAWARNPAGDKAENRKKAIVAFEAALTVYSAGAPTRPRLGAEITLSWVRLLAKDFAGALATASRAAEDGNVNLPLEANHAHALLLLGRADEAEAMYFNHVGERIGEKTWEQVVLQDFDRLEKNGIVSPEFPKLRELLKQAAEKKQLSGEPAPAARPGP